MSFSLAMISAFTTALVFLFEPATSETINFIVEPAVETIQLNQMLNVTLQCRVNSTGHSYKPMWTLHYPDTDRFLSTHDDNDKEIIAKHGIHFYSGETVANITIPGTVENNRTQIWCTILHNGVTEFSDQIKIIIAGSPLPPSPKLKVLSSSQLELQWEIPYSYESDPIQHYNVQILNTNSGHKFDNSVTQNRYIYTTEHDNTTQCDLLVFNVTAVSALGQNALGKVSGGFPIAPKLFASQINVAVTFYGNGTPIAKVSFKSPFICDYQTSYLTITIEDITALTVMPALVHQSTYTGRDKNITETFDTGLLANHAYTLTITTSDSTFVEDTSTATVNFSTTFHCALPSTQGESSGLHMRDIMIFAGGVFAVLVAITTIVIVIVCSRKRKLSKAPGSTMDLMLNSINRSRAGSRINSSQYDNPYKSSSSLYETIDGYQKHTPAHKATTQVWQQQQYLCKPQQCNYERKRSGDSIETDTLYQEMHSACASEQGLVNGYDRNHVTKPQNLAASHNHPLKLHACRVELHSAPTDGSDADPFCMNNSDANTHLSQSESFGDHVSTIAVVNENVGTTNDACDRSEYTYMSQAGTLAGQQSKLTLCTNGCVSADNQDRDSSEQ